MKKVLALVLAVMMLATVAFAADGTAVPGNQDKPSTDPTLTAPGTKLKVGEGDIIGAANTKAVNSTNYSISNIKYEDGKALVESIKFDDNDDRLVIKLKQDYTMTTPKTLKMSLVLKGKKSGKNGKPDDVLVTVEKTVGYKLYDKTCRDSAIVINDTDEVIVPDDINTQAAVRKVIKDDKAVYGTMELTALDTDVEVEVRVYDGDKFFLVNNIDADDDILKKYADADADISFLTFEADPTFNSTATVRFYKDEDSFIYGMKDGKLVNVNAKWDDDEGCFILKTRTLGAYVFSDKKLSVSTPAAGSENPDTGANDVVGIATALAAVALVSAAAVSLKK